MNNTNDKSNNKYNGNGKSLMLSLFGVMVSLLLGALTVVFYSVGAIKDAVDATEDRSKERNITLDAALQNEIKAVDIRIAESVTSLDTRLQGEIAALKELLEQRAGFEHEQVLTLLEAHANTSGHKNLAEMVKELREYHKKHPKAGP